MTDMDWLMYANIAVWIGLGAYLAFLLRNQIALNAALPSWRPCAMTDQTFGKNRRSILLLITAGLVLMLVSTLSYFSANPGLVSHTTTGTQAAAPSGQQMPTSAGMDEATQQGVMALMQKTPEKPHGP